MEDKAAYAGRPAFALRAAAWQARGRRMSAVVADGSRHEHVVNAGTKKAAAKLQPP